MPSLRELQEAFVQATLFGETDALAAFVVNEQLAADERIAIYANNARENFTATLEAAFPVVRALGGEDWFRQSAYQYWLAQPSRSGNLHYIGLHFATYLEQQLGASEHAYFADVARLEWAYQESMFAADHPGFDVQALASISPEDYATLRFALHPAARLIASPYPVLDVWSAHQPGATLDAIDLNAGAQWIVLSRRSDHVQFRALDEASWTLLRSLANGASLGAAAEDALTVAANFDLTTALGLFIRLSVLVDFSSPEAVH